jgi:hypothetical protein
MDVAAVNVGGGDGSPARAGYRRSTGSPRGEARRRELLDRVSDDLAVNGLVDFSLRRAARPGEQTLAQRVRAVWPALLGEESRVLDQAIGLMMYDPVRYAELGRGASQQYLPTVLSICPPEWTDRRKLEVAEMILASLRGFLIDWLTSGSTTGVESGFEALARALDREEAAGA